MARLYGDGRSDKRRHEVDQGCVRLCCPSKLRLEVIRIDRKALAVHCLEEVQRAHLHAWRGYFADKIA